MSSDSSKSKCKLILIFSVILLSIFMIVFISWTQSEAQEAKESIRTSNEIQEVKDTSTDKTQSKKKSKTSDSKTSSTSKSEKKETQEDNSNESEKEKIEKDTSDQSSQNLNNSSKANIIYIDSYQFKQDGVWYDSRYRYTYYSSQVLYHYRTSEWTAGQDGVYRDSDGYVIVSSSDLSQGTVITDTPFGDCKVYDTGCASGTLDVYVNW